MYSTFMVHHHTFLVAPIIIGLRSGPVLVIKPGPITPEPHLVLRGMKDSFNVKEKCLSNPVQICQL